MVLKYNFKKSLLFQLTMEAAERDLLTLLEKHTQKGKCPLAGNSVGQVQFNQGCIFCMRSPAKGGREIKNI